MKIARHLSRANLTTHLSGAGARPAQRRRRLRLTDGECASTLCHIIYEKGVPMASRNLPASFFNAAAAGPACAGLDLYDYDPWHQHYAGYGHAAHRHAAEYHAAAAHHNMAAAGYGGLLLGRGSLHAQYKPVDWPAHAHAHAHAHAAHAHAHHAHAHHASPHLDPAACSPYSYPAPPGQYHLPT
ncbi:unnamed protein product [Euphydryas editha]|uniref:Vestigial n=1 Tax=Euphydryas editha TaxID=104508 RepID=A0AAU9V6G4_EUPED|nr:unnamed protein product [Euphydryas editha]